MGGAGEGFRPFGYWTLGEQERRRSSPWRETGGILREDRVWGSRIFANSIEILHSLKPGDSAEGEVGEGMVERR